MKNRFNTHFIFSSEISPLRVSVSVRRKALMHWFRNPLLFPKFVIEFLYYLTNSFLSLLSKSVTVASLMQEKPFSEETVPTTSTQSPSLNSSPSN